MLNLLLDSRRMRLRLLILSALLMLSACASFPAADGKLPAARGSTTAANAAEARQDWQQAAAEWLALAGDKQDAQAQLYRVNALSALLRAQDNLRARVIFDGIEPSLLSEYDAETLAVLQAELLLQEGRPAEALVVLPLALSASAPTDLQKRFLLTRAGAFAEQGALVSAIEDFTASNQWPSTVADNQQWQLRLWPLLVSTEERVLRKGLRRNKSSAVEGWLRLGLIGQQEWLEPERFEQQLDSWENQFRLHAANTMLVPALRESHRRRQTYPQNIAVMLPLSGRYAAVGSAVRDGLLAAWYALPNDRGANLRFFDTEEPLPTAWLKTQQQDWAVIGPLRKEKLEALADSDLMHDALWLPLNQLAEATDDFPVALALSPEQEAELVAERVGRDGYRRALVIAAEGDWGRRVADAFAQRFVETGGKVVGIERYDSAQTDYGDTIQRALLLNKSEQRHARMSRALGRNIEFEPRRRADVDVVFAPGNPRSLRALRPQLKFYRAGSVPVYATSHAWQGKVNPAADLDLNGVRFADMPWNLKPSVNDRKLKKAVSVAGGRDRHGRFYALGADAIRLLPILTGQEDAFPWVFPGGTGMLQAGEGDLIQRRLLWAEFKKGKPVLVPAAKLDADS